MVQTEIVGACGGGTYITEIHPDGSVTCEADLDTDTDTTYRAGAGLRLSGTFFSIPTDGIYARMIASGAVDSAEISDGAIDSGHFSTGAVDSAAIADDAVGMAALSLISGSEAVQAFDMSGGTYMMSSVTVTPPASGVCLVTTDFHARGITTTSTGDAWVRTARQVGSDSPTVDPHVTGYAVSPGTSTNSTGLSASYPWAVIGGTSYFVWLLREPER